MARPLKKTTYPLKSAQSVTGRSPGERNGKEIGNRCFTVPSVVKTQKAIHNLKTDYLCQHQ